MTTEFELGRLAGIEEAAKHIEDASLVLTSHLPARLDNERVYIGKDIAAVIRALAQPPPSEQREKTAVQSTQPACVTCGDMKYVASHFKPHLRRCPDC